MNARAFVVAAALLASSSVGCAGAETRLIAPDADFPVSLTRGVRDERGVLVTADRRQVVGKFEETRLAWGVLYSAIDLTPTTDLSKSINAQVAAAHGQAIVRLKVASADCALDWFFPLTFLPIWPGCTTVHIEGDIVRVTPESTAEVER